MTAPEAAEAGDLAARTAYYFGTFNPIHWGHLLIAQAALNQFALARVVFIPAACSPFRQGEPAMASATDRLAMLRLAIADHPQLAVDPLELDAACGTQTPSYTIHTLRALRARQAGLSEKPVPVIIGSDALATLAQWREPRALIHTALFLQAPRPNTPPVSAIRLDAEELPLATRLIAMPTTALSASYVRATLAAGHSARYLTPEPVLAYIGEHRLWAPPAGGECPV